MIEIKDLNKSFGKQQVLKEINIEFNPNKTTAVLGPNGSGKTTLMKSILGMVLPDSGAIEFNNKSVLKEFSYRNSFGYLPQIAHFPENSTARELIQFMESMKTTELCTEELIQLFDLEDELDKKCKELSGGNKQKVNLVMALMHQSDVLILDEPSNGLDPLSLSRLKTYLKSLNNKGKIILITTHIMSMAQNLADEVLFLLDGQVYFKGSLQSLLKNEGEADLEKAIANILERNGNEK